MKLNTENAKKLVQALDRSTIENHSLKIGIMCVIAKECGFNLRREHSYSNTGNARLKKLFSVCRYVDDAVLSELKKDNVKFFDLIYGGKLGNRKYTSDAWDYRGWGFNQITGRDNFERLGVDITLLKDADHAAEKTVQWFEEQLKNINVEKLKKRYYVDTTSAIDSDLEGVLLMCNINAGFGHGKESTVVQRAYKSAMQHYYDVVEIYWKETR